MSSTGDVQNCLRKLQTELRLIKFRDVDYKSLKCGNPCELLKIYHYVFLDYSPAFAKKLLSKCNCELYAKTDSGFIDSMYKALRDYFNYKPSLTKDQFFTTGFAERKLQMACDIISMIKNECKDTSQQQSQHIKRPVSTLVKTFDKDDKYSKAVSTSQQQFPTFYPLRDMGLEMNDNVNQQLQQQYAVNNEQDHGQENQLLTLPQQKRIENWLNLSQFDHENNVINKESVACQTDTVNNLTTISRLEEQIKILKTKLEDVYSRLDNVTLLLQGKNLSSSDIPNFNARLIIIENELALLKNKTPLDSITHFQNTNNVENKVIVESKKTLRPCVPQGILAGMLDN
ncbi:unnamed protein product [Didymodactylos carnosus]|uniref:Centrosomal protein of 44 kDa n=1 Tax=Didymodactylos carnosus TaxID=1234261 RepID=A0A8S2T9S3_9BILA|nr:unnamed protein product [Didymodactylos carnosus]CAF4278914.1 unnamed protein product [Didymodactylos carnosus]